MESPQTNFQHALLSTSYAFSANNSWQRYCVFWYAERLSACPLSVG